MNWQILLIVSIFSYSLAVLSQRVLMKDNHSEPISYSVFFQLMTGIMIGLFGFFTANMTLPKIQPLLFNIFLMIMLYALTNIFVFKAIKLIEASEYTIIFASRGLFTIIGSTIFLHEGLKSAQFLGAFLILLAVTIVTFKKTQFKLSIGEILTLLGAMCMGFAATNDRYLLGYFNVYVYVSLAFILPAFFTALIYPRKMIFIKNFLNGKILSKMFLMCIFYAISSITFFSALQVGKNSSQIATLNLLSIIIIVILSTIFLKERTFVFRKIIGAIISVIGAYLVK